VVEVVLPPGYELVKEEDKNILIGDNFIAPVTQEFPGLGGYVFIIPDQASVATSYQGTPISGAQAYNPNNAQNPTQSLGTTPVGDTVPAFPIEPVWPCVGQSRIVPDYISLFPQSKEVSPFAGATRNMCDRKEVTLSDQSASTAKFYIFTSTHKAAKFTGVITDDFTSEFDPFSPQFGEKFAPPNQPISVKDWTGQEISRVYSDWWGDYDGMTYSTWEVNPPNPTGYSPTMMVFCMNDPGPIPNPNGTGTITDPLFNPAYSDFCYELPFMPGQTQYLDTPVVPTSAFSDGYNHPDCAYPVATPAVSEVDGDGIGPWVSAAGKTLTITALGDQLVNNYAYSGPGATVAPYNQKTITRHYGFGGTKGTVTIGGVSVPSGSITTWSDTSIVLTVPSGVPACPVQQQAQYGGPGAPGVTTAYCGQLAITTAAGQQSVDTVTVTIGGKKPTYVPNTNPLTTTATGAIQQTIDAAMPGDLIIVPAGTYNEMVLQWKPVRLQGVGAASSVINANTQPAGKLDPWRRQLDCLFGVSLNGQPITPASPGNAGNPYDSTGTYSCPAAMNFAVDRIDLEAILGWDTNLNGNIAEQLQEPSLMGAYEGAGITVMGKGVIFGPGNPLAEAFPAGSKELTAGDCGPNTTSAKNPYPGNYQCNPSSIDGLTVTDSSQGGGGIFVHAWAHNLQIANNRVYNNAGTLSGGVTIGQGEFPPQYIVGDTTGTNISCLASSVTSPIGLQLPYCFNLNVNVHHNYVTNNSSLGDELFSATLAGAGGVTFCTGADYYKFNYNWLCGNESGSDGGGMAHMGFMYNGDIEHNSILFNQSLNPTIPTNGGGLVVMGAPDTDPVCGADVGATADQDCPPGLSDGIGPGLVINANLFQGNSAESGSGGAIRVQQANGTEITNYPTTPSLWYSLSITNNIIANNVAGWDGAGISLQDVMAANIVNNTIISNDSTASAGPLFNTLGAPLGSSPGPPVSGQVTSSTTSAPQPAGLVVVPNSPPLLAAFASTTGVTCPTGHYAPGTNANNGTCVKISYPVLANNVFWQNRSFYIGVGALSPAYQQNIVSLYNSFSGSAAATQPSADATSPNGNGVVVTGGSGACTPGASYWDIGVRGDTGPSNHGSGFTLSPMYSVLTDAAADYSGSSLHNLALNPDAVSQYCNGSRIPPECTTADGCYGAGGFNVPPGISDATVPNPVFSLLPSATVDEGNNWVNMTWGPLSMTNPVSGVRLGNYALAVGSPAIDRIPSSESLPGGVTYPTTDFFGNTRPDNSTNIIDVGAVEYQGASTLVGPSVSPTSLAFGNVTDDTVSSPQFVTLSNPAATTLTFTIGFTGAFSRAAAPNAGTCVSPLAAASTCTIGVVFSPSSAQTPPYNYTGSLTITATPAVTGSPVALTGTGVAVTGAVSVSPTTTTAAPLSFGAVTISDASAPQTVTLINTTGATVTGIAVSASSQYSRSGGTCGTTLAGGGASCTIIVVFTPTALGTITGTLTIATNVAVTGSPVSLSGTGVVPALSVLDTFNRANATALRAVGYPWYQVGATTTAALQVFDVSAGDTTTGVADCTGTACTIGGTAYWPLSPTGNKLGASFQFENTSGTVNATTPGYSLLLKATGAGLTGAAASATSVVRVTYIPASGTVTIAYTANGGLSYTPAPTTPATILATFAGGAPGDLMGAMVDSTGKVWVWKISGVTTTLLGTAQLPTTTTTWTTAATGIIGMQLPVGGQVDNFAGGVVP
jgi:hypothetical protein